MHFVRATPRRTRAKREPVSILPQSDQDIRWETSSCCEAVASLKRSLKGRLQGHSAVPERSYMFKVSDSDWTHPVCSAFCGIDGHQTFEYARSNVAVAETFGSAQNWMDRNKTTKHKRIWAPSFPPFYIHFRPVLKFEGAQVRLAIFSAPKDASARLPIRESHDTHRKRWQVQPT